MTQSNTTVEDLMKEYDLTVEDVKLLIERHVVDKLFEDELEKSWDTMDFTNFDKAGGI
jgi:hypothetical protein|tara:strand:- start:1125 stop:1298 length:174 start_codon:yes stop_codon:yes gene_type:complete